MKRISMRQAFVNAIDETDPTLTRYENQAMKWGKYIEREIGSYSGQRLQAKAYTVEGSVIMLPDNCLHVLEVIHGDFEEQVNKFYQNSFELAVNEDVREINDQVEVKLWSPMDQYVVPRMQWEQFGDQLELTTNMNGRTVTLFFMGIEVDSQNYWMVNQSHVKAITDYMIYMFAKKHLWRSLKSEKMIRQTEIVNLRDLKFIYEASIRNARAQDGNETEYERRRY